MSAAKLAPNSVGSAKLANGSVTSGKLAAGSVGDSALDELLSDAVRHESIRTDGVDIFDRSADESGHCGGGGGRTATPSPYGSIHFYTYTFQREAVEGPPTEFTIKRWDREDEVIVLDGPGSRSGEGIIMVPPGMSNATFNFLLSASCMDENVGNFVAYVVSTRLSGEFYFPGDW